MQKIYLIKCESFYKIGIANDVQSRVAQLATGNPFKLEVLAIYEFETANAIEAAIHQLFNNVRVKGEWFQLDSQHIEKFHDICQLLGGAANELPTIANQDIEDAEVLAIPSKFDFRAMFVDGWRMEPTSSNGNNDKYWCWRRGSGIDREYIYGGTVAELPYQNLETMRQKYGK